MERLRKRYGAFLVWQRLPHQVAPLSDEEHDCPTCATHYQGNYCPRCGQSAKISRYSFKNAFLLFLDVWGLGNRGMFRTLRDLLLRPGYMIRDYLQGMQMAYFPPFKMFFLLITLSLLVDSGLNLQGRNLIKQQKEQFEKGLEDSEKDTWESEAVLADSADGLDKSAGGQADSSEEQAGREKDEKTRQYIVNVLQFSKNAFEWLYKNMTLVMLGGLLLVSWPLYLMFRHCPAIPDMQFSEFFVAMVFTSNMLTIYSVVISFLCLPSMLQLFASLSALVSLKQLSGYGYWRTALKAAVALSIFLIMLGLLSFLFGVFAVLYVFRDEMI